MTPKPSNGDVPLPEITVMQYTPLLPLNTGPLRATVKVPVKISAIGQIRLLCVYYAGNYLNLVN